MPTNLPLLYSMLGWHWGSLMSFTCSLSKAEIQGFKEVPYSPPRFSCHTQSTGKCPSCLYSFYTFSAVWRWWQKQQQQCAAKKPWTATTEPGCTTGRRCRCSQPRSMSWLHSSQPENPFLWLPTQLYKTFVFLFVDNMDYLIHNKTVKPNGLLLVLIVKVEFCKGRSTQMKSIFYATFIDLKNTLEKSVDRRQKVPFELFGHVTEP